MRRIAVLVASLAALCSSSALAQSQVHSDLSAVYALWGFMERVGSVCTELTNDPTYVTAYEDWKAGHSPIRAEVDKLLSASGEDRALVAAAEQTAGDGIEPGLRAAATPHNPCATWLSNIGKGSYEPELYVEPQLARLRSPDGD